MQHALLLHLDQNFSRLLTTLKFLGIVEIQNLFADPTIFQTEHQRLEFRFDRVGKVFATGDSWLRDVYGWGTPASRMEDLLDNASDLLGAFGASVDALDLPRKAEEFLVGHAVPEADTNPASVAAIQLGISLSEAGPQLGVSLMTLRAENAAKGDAGLAVSPFWSGLSGSEFPLLGGESKWALVLLATPEDVNSGLFIMIRPDQPVQAKARVFEGPPGSVGDGSRRIGLRFKDPGGTRSALIESEAGSGLQFGEGFVNFGIETRGGSTEAFTEVGVKGGRLVLRAQEMDGLIGSAAGEGEASVAFDVAVGFSTVSGLSFSGAGALDLSFALKQEFGAIRLTAIRFSLRGSAEGLSLSAGLDGSLALGPVDTGFENMGIRAVFEFRDGNLGPVDSKLRFQFPDGVGIAVSAGPVQGGGFLFFDEPNGRYGGALVLKVYSVTVKALGLIETKLPDGAKGFSFVIVISAEFTPIQLGLGFTLNGVGGIIGINRRIDEEGLRRAVRDGSLAHLLFPRDVQHDAPQIIHDLTAILPATEGRHVFGPMAKIGWGTPTIIEAEIGIILELPGPRLALLGEVHALLPKKDKGLVTLNLSVAGLLDFPKKFFAIDAPLHDSKVGSYPITGDMAMRLLWGDNPSFALAVGGFNPAFQPPPSFPTLRRVAIDLGVSGNPSLTLQGYFALTSNTAQVGAVAELRASGSGIRLYGRVQFDAIFVFSPFSFEAAISAQVRVTFHGRGIGVHLHGMLSGPSPWRVRGKVCVSVLFWDACLSFNKSFGSAQPVDVPAINPWTGTPEAAPPKEVLGLKDALQDVRNRTPEPPPGAVAVVSLAEASQKTRPIDPLGVAVVRQRVCPFNLQLQRFGSAKAMGPAKFVLESVKVNDTTINLETITYLKEPFAKAQFLHMTDAQKLSAPSFERLDGAIRIPANNNAIVAGSIRSKEIKYRTKVLGAPAGAPAVPDHLLPEEHLAGMKRRSAMGLSGLRRVGAGAYIDPTAPPRFVFGSELFVIGNRKTFRTRSGILSGPVSKIEATLALAQHLVNNPDERDDLQVFPKFEMGGR